MPIVVLDLFQTSLGNIAILSFLDENRPRIGMVLKNSTNSAWEISGIGSNRKLDSDNMYAKFNANSIWDCVIKPLNHSHSLEVKDELEIK